MLGVEIVFLSSLPSMINLAVPDLDRFARQADDAFDVAFIRLFRIPEDDDVAAFDMAPADAVDLVIDKLVDQQPFAVVKLRQHRCAFDHYRLDGKNAE